MEILLGRYSSEYFNKMRRDYRYNWSIWPFTPLLGEDLPSIGLIGLVEMACRKASQVNFLLDSLSLPLSESSWTCMELKTILFDEQIFKKTQFWIKGKKLDREEVKNKLLDRANYGKHMEELGFSKIKRNQLQLL